MTARRENNRFLDTRIARLEAELLELRDTAELTNPATAGVDGIAVWALAALSAALASTAADSLRSTLLRLTAPAVAACCGSAAWPASGAVRGRGPSGTGGSTGGSTERILVRPGIAAPSGRTASRWMHTGA